MKISYNKKGDPRDRHLCLSVTAEERFDARAIVVSELLPPRTRPVEEFDQVSGKYVMRFNLRYFDRLALAFPMAELSSAVTKKLRRVEEKRLADMPVPKIKLPGFKGKLYDFQKIAVGKIINEEIDLLTDEMGLGKTLESFAAVRKLKAFPCLVVCPNGAKFNWKRELDEKFDVESVVVDGTKAERQMQIEKRAQVTIVNFEAIRAKPIHEDGNRYKKIVGYEYTNPALFDYEYDFVIVDEFHRVKTPTAQVSRGFLQLEGKRWLGMSGTPILNRPEEIWTVLHKLYPEDFPYFDTFRNTIGIEVNGRIVGYRPEPMAELRDFIQKISLRRRKDQVLKDLPKVLKVKRPVILTTEARKLYNEIKEDFILRMEDGSIKNIHGALPQITRLKQACFSPELYGGSRDSAKMEELQDIVRELVANGEKAIIYSQWSRATRIVRRELEAYNPAYVTGEINLRNRQEEIKRFNKDSDCKLYIGTIGANREAINLGVATYVIFTDVDWTPASNDQAVGRSAAGGLRGLEALGTKVHVIELQAEDTIEQRIEGLLNYKRALTDRTIERDGGRVIEKITLKDLKEIL